jgi:hypothetical protein
MAEEEKPENTSETAAAAAESPVPASEPQPVQQPAGSAQPSRLQRFKSWYGDRKKWTIPLSVLLLILILAAIPFTRYSLAGLAVKKDFSVKVVDATAGTPVSGATVTYGGASAETDASGKAQLRHVKPGRHSLTFSKKYYKDTQQALTIPLLSQKNVPQVNLTATGRQVKVSVKNLINKKALANVEITAAGATAKTDQTGSATIVLPAGDKQQPAKLSLDGYIDASVSLKVSSDQIVENSFSLTPAGKVYFLSKLSGTIDVVKTNLDGTDRQTVLAGTGKEDDQNTVLLASRDWKYLALLSKRSGAEAIYLIDTSSDSLSTMDSGDASFSLLGWSDNYFSYVVSRNNIPAWQPKAASIKSYNAQTKQLLTLDSTSASGTSNDDAVYEAYTPQPVLLDDMIVYIKTWYKYPGFLTVTGQTNRLNEIRPNGSAKKQIKTADAASQYFTNLTFHTPASLYLQIGSPNGSKVTDYELNASGVLAQKDSLTDNDFFKQYPTYLFSPSDQLSFWAEPRDGKNTLFIGDETGSGGKQIATLSDYTPYGWYTDNYLLVSKNSSELYIMPKSGGDTIKISDYHKPAQSFQGYGGGYGGL